MSDVKERPILFSAPMVRAILAGTKTQTRRVVKLPSAPMHLGEWTPCTIGGPGVRDARGVEVPAEAAIWHTRTGKTVACPYGAPGDRLWVRETWQPIWRDDVEYPPGYDEPEKWAISYPATDGIREYCHPDRGLTTACKPGIHMPRFASRITLEVTGVRVKRLHDISGWDVVAEGIDRESYCCGCEGCTRTVQMCTATESALVLAYANLWRSINGDESWDANPWVWVIEFRRVVAQFGERAA